MQGPRVSYNYSAEHEIVRYRPPRGLFWKRISFLTNQETMRLTDIKIFKKKYNAYFFSYGYNAYFFHTAIMLIFFIRL